MSAAPVRSTLPTGGPPDQLRAGVGDPGRRRAQGRASGRSRGSLAGTDRPNPTAHLAGGDRRNQSMAQHRAPRYVRTKKVIARAPIAAGATVVGLGILSSPAQPSTTHDWTGVAQCESGGDWSINTGNGYYGGLQ